MHFLYSGIRPIAVALALVLLGGAAWAQSPAPAQVAPPGEERLQINRVMDILGITDGKSVGDIGAGSGWFTVRAGKRVGAGGTVYAVDINPEAIRYIGARAKKEQLKNVKTILSKAENPMLPDQSV